MQGQAWGPPWAAFLTAALSYTGQNPNGVQDALGDTSS
jgi:hypothetical protein